MQQQRQLLLSEIDERCAAVSSDRLLHIVCKLLAHYFDHAADCSAEQIDLYDESLLALTRNLCAAGMSEVSNRLARSDHSPAMTLAFLAQNADIEIAGPVLRHARLPDDVIKAVVDSKQGPQLLAVASRSVVSSDVSIMLIASDIPAVIGQTVKNHGAALSEMAFSLLIGLAAKDKELARLIALRTDIPEELRSFIDMILH